MQRKFVIVWLYIIIIIAISFVLSNKLSRIHDTIVPISFQPLYQVPGLFSIFGRCFGFEQYILPSSNWMWYSFQFLIPWSWQPFNVTPFLDNTPSHLHYLLHFIPYSLLHSSMFPNELSPDSAHSQSNSIVHTLPHGFCRSQMYSIPWMHAIWRVFSKSRWWHRVNVSWHSIM